MTIYKDGDPAVLTIGEKTYDCHFLQLEESAEISYQDLAGPASHTPTSNYAEHLLPLKASNSFRIRIRMENAPDFTDSSAYHSLTTNDGLFITVISFFPLSVTVCGDGEIHFCGCAEPLVVHVPAPRKVAP